MVCVCDPVYVLKNSTNPELRLNRAPSGEKPPHGVTGTISVCHTQVGFMKRGLNLHQLNHNVHHQTSTLPYDGSDERVLNKCLCSRCGAASGMWQLPVGNTDPGVVWGRVPHRFVYSLIICSSHLDCVLAEHQQRCRDRSAAQQLHTTSYLRGEPGC